MDNRELAKCTRIAATKAMENSHGMSRKKRFAMVYGAALLFVAQNRPEEYGVNYTTNTANAIAERMTDSLSRRRANFDSIPIRVTCTLLGIQFGMLSIADWLNERGPGTVS